MDLDVRLSYPAAPSEVAAMLCDPAFQRRLCEATGDAHADVAAAADEVRTARRLPTDGFPDSLRHLVGPTVTTVQTTRWQPMAADGSRDGSVSVVIEGTPVRLDATVHVAADGTGTAVLYSGHLTAKMPLVGGRVERAAEPVVRRALEKEEQVGRGWLAEPR